MCKQVFDYAHWQTLSRCRPFCNIRHAEHWHLFVHKPNSIILSQNWNSPMFLWRPRYKIYKKAKLIDMWYYYMILVKQLLSPEKYGKSWRRISVVEVGQTRAQCLPNSNNNRPTTRQFDILSGKPYLYLSNYNKV